MKIKTIGVEDYLNVWEHDAKWDIAQSTIDSLTMEEILAISDEEARTTTVSTKRR